MFPEGMFWMFSWWFSFVCFFGNTNPFYVSEYEGMQQQKAASAVSQRLPAIVEDCCKITDLIQFKLRLHEQLIWGDKGSELGNCPSFSCQGDNQITGESMCTSRRLGGAVLSFQMVGISRHNFFSSFESITVPCLTTIHALKNYEAPGDWTTFLCWLKGSKTAISWTHHGDQQDSTLSHSASGTKVTVGILRMRRKPFYRLLISVHVNNLKSKDFENSESVNFLSD